MFKKAKPYVGRPFPPKLYATWELEGLDEFCLKAEPSVNSIAVVGGTKRAAVYVLQETIEVTAGAQIRSTDERT